MSDLFFDALRAALNEAAPKIVRETCPYCVRGNVEVHDGTPFPALAICSQCCGKGYINVEAKHG